MGTVMDSDLFRYQNVCVNDKLLFLSAKRNWGDAHYVGLTRNFGTSILIIYLKSFSKIDSAVSFDVMAFGCILKFFKNAFDLYRCCY